MPRVVALVPAAVEILVALGLADSLVGLCDVPESRSAELGQVERVTFTNESQQDLDAAHVRALAPDLVFAGGPDDPIELRRRFVRGCVADWRPRPAIYAVAPATVGEMLSAVKTVGDAIGEQARARALIGSLAARIDRVTLRSARAVHRPRAVCLLEDRRAQAGGGVRMDGQRRGETLTTTIGRWAPELVGLAGGIDPLSSSGLPPRRCTWEELASARPDYYIVARQAHADIPSTLRGLPTIEMDDTMLAVPGPRLVDGLEHLAGMFADYSARGRGTVAAGTAY